MFGFLKKRKTEFCRVRAVEVFWEKMEKEKYAIVAMIMKLAVFMYKRGMGTEEEITAWQNSTYKLLGMKVSYGEYSGEMFVDWDKTSGNILIEV